MTGTDTVGFNRVGSEIKRMEWLKVGVGVAVTGVVSVSRLMADICGPKNRR